MAGLTGTVALSIESGHVRDNQLVLTVAHPPGFDDWGALEIELQLFPDGVQSIAASTVRDGQLDGHRARLRAPAPPGILSAVRVRPVSAREADLAVSYAEAYALHALFPEDEGEEVPTALSRANTIRDVETLEFVVAQMLAHDRYSSYAKTEAVKKLAYMAMQTGEVEQVRRAIELIDAQLPQVAEFKAPRGKKHPTHLRVSFLFIRMLAYVVVGDFPAALADMATLHELRAEVGEAPLVGSNLSRAVLIYGWVLAAGGETERAVIVFNDVIAMFREAAACMPARRQRPFLELNTTLRSAGQAINYQIALRGRSGPWEKACPAFQVASQYSRLAGEGGQRRLAIQLSALADHVRACAASGAVS